MRRISASLGVLLFAAGLVPASADARSPHSLPSFAYVSPAPGTGLHRTRTNIIVRPGGEVRASSLDPATTIVVTGSATGKRAGELRLSDDGETILFRPDLPFLAGETVTCVVAAGIEVKGRAPLPRAEFSFRIAGIDAEPPPDPIQSIAAEAEAVLALGGGGRGLPFVGPARPAAAPAAGETRGRTEEAPPLSTMILGDTAPGDLFLCDFRLGSVPHQSHLMIARNDGTLVFERPLPGQGLDFKVQPDGRITYFDQARDAFYALDPSFAVVDSFRCGNGYATDPHELRLLENGHALLMSYDPQHLDLSGVVPGGGTDVIVIGLVIQEFDLAKEVVFQWRSWDHFRLTDTTSQSLTGRRLDYAHGNAIERDRDGGLLISSRHMDEITKIDRETGDVVWRLGGKNSDFTFVNDPERFSHQHAVRRLANGNILLFDNGNFHVPPRSRAAEYALDEQSKTATLVWQYRATPDLFGYALGYAQRLENGNTLIAWGACPTTVTEVTPDGHKVFEAWLPAPLFSYRVARHEWPPRLAAHVTLEPRVLGASSQGSWVTASIEPRAFDAGEIDVAGIRLAGDLAPDPREAVVQDGGSGGHGALRVRFDRKELLARLHPGSNEVEITGPLRSGARFRERIEMRVVGSGSRAAPRVVSAPGALPAKLRPPSRGAFHVLEVFDVQGRLVRRWRAPADERGDVAWDGRGPSGRRVPAGIYFIRDAARPGAGAARIVIAR